MRILVSLEKLQTWLKNSNKFKPPLDIDQTADEFIQNLKKLKEIAKKTTGNPGDTVNEISMLLGKMEISLVELANRFNLNIDNLLRDKFKLLDSGSKTPPKHPVTIEKGPET